MPDPVDYKSPATDAPHPKRSLATWLILIAVWIAGIIMWAVYVTAVVLLLFRFL
ncbi:MAG TPA: hypothetical protein VH518_21085 [Tepidisphaeraceae bacterium]|jgi:hypothetical protein